MLSRLLIFFANRQETDRVVLLDKKAAPGKHPRTSLGMLFLFYELLKIMNSQTPMTRLTGTSALENVGAHFTCARPGGDKPRPYGGFSQGVRKKDI
jgi:hypothetical protein